MYSATSVTAMLIAFAMVTTVTISVAAEREKSFSLNTSLERKKGHYPVKVQDKHDWRRIIMASPDTQLVSNLKHEDEAHEQIAVAAVIAAVDLTIALLSSIVAAIRAVERKIAIGIANETPTTWSDPDVYFFSGTSDVVAPHTVEPGKALTYGARKNNGVARGAVGVIGYRMDDGNTLAVMFSVPFDYNLYENQWNARVYPGKVPIGYKLYEDQYYLIPSFKGDNSYHKKELGQGYRMRGAMNSAGAATLEIHVTKD